jgi:hypothetical protein
MVEQRWNKWTEVGLPLRVFLFTQLNTPPEALRDVNSFGGLDRLTKDLVVTVWLSLI